MNPQRLHVYQLIPLLLLSSLLTKAPPFVSYPVGFDAAMAMVLTSFLAFFFSLGRQGLLRRVLMLANLSMMLALVLNKLVYSPTLGTLVCCLYILVIVTRVPSALSYRRLFLASETSLLIAFFAAAIFYSLILYEPFADIRLLFYATSLALGTVAYIACAKIRMSEKLGYWLTLGIPMVAIFLLLHDNPVYFLPVSTLFFVAIATLSSIAFFMGRSTGLRELLLSTFSRPELIIVSYFCVIAVLGAFLLQMPAAQHGLYRHPFIDSLFTAMSAVSVTGLGVLDTGTRFTPFGQGIILLLIQLGGLGIVSMSAWVLFVFQSKRLSIQHEQTIADLSAHNPKLLPGQMIQRILIYFFSFELLGTLVLFWAFLDFDQDVGTALWRAIFTAVSAFCNAGFALQSDSLIPYQNSFTILLTASLLIVAGGLAPLLATEFATVKARRFSLHDKLAISMTVSLLAGGWLTFLALEWGHSLYSLPTLAKLSNAWFQSVTTRTAGFNSVDLLSLREGTVVIMMVLMFIGGNPGSTAGGIKTVTAAVIFFAGLNALRGETHTRAFGRTIASETVSRAIAIVGLGLLGGALAFMMLSLTQPIATIPLMFEAIAAMATVGLSLGATSEIDEVGKIILIICMLAGRVGPLTFVLVLVRSPKSSSWGLPKEDIYIS